MKHIALLLLILPLFIGCFDTQPPPGVVGQIVGCAETENAIFCITEYPKTGTPVTPTPTPPATPPATITPGTLSDIVTDVDNGGRFYLEKTVTITATVEFNLGNSITLVTNNEWVAFFVDPLGDYEAGNTYTFTLFIEAIRLSTANPGQINIWSNEVD